MNPSAEMLQLLDRCREGDALAVQALVRTFKTPVYRLALSMLHDPAEADEATQDAFVAALGKLDSFRGDAQLKTWLYAITLNVCRGRLRQRHRRERVARVLHALLPARGDSEIHPDEHMIRSEQDAALWRAVNALRDEEREVILLRYYHELSVREMAQVVGVSERTIRTRAHQAHERLRALLQKSE